MTRGDTGKSHQPCSARRQLPRGRAKRGVWDPKPTKASSRQLKGGARSWVRPTRPPPSTAGGIPKPAAPDFLDDATWRGRSPGSGRSWTQQAALDKKHLRGAGQSDEDNHCDGKDPPTPERGGEGEGEGGNGIQRGQEGGTSWRSVVGCGTGLQPGRASRTLLMSARDLNCQQAQMPSTTWQLHLDTDKFSKYAPKRHYRCTRQNDSCATARFSYSSARDWGRREEECTVLSFTSRS